MSEPIDVRPDTSQQFSLTDDTVLDLDAMRDLATVPTPRMPATPGVRDSSYYLG